QQLTVDQAASTDIGFTGDFFAANGIPAPSITQTGSAGDASHAAADVIDFVGNNWPLTIGRHLVGSNNLGAESATGNILVNNPGMVAPFFLSSVTPLIPIVGVPGNGDNIKISSAFAGGFLQIFEGANTGVASESITVGATGG